MTGSYVSCTTGGGSTVFQTLGIDDPGNSPNSHFDYLLTMSAGPGIYSIVAQRNTRDLGMTDPGGSVTCGGTMTLDIDNSLLVLCQDLAGNIKIAGSGFYQNLQ